METGTPEEQQFDFGVDASPATGRRRRGRSTAMSNAGLPAGQRAEDATAELRAKVARLQAKARQGSTSVVPREVPDDRVPRAPFEMVGAVVTAEVRDRDRETRVVDAELSIVEEIAEEEAIDDSLTISEFYRRLKRTISSEFPDEVWVTGEIRGMRDSKGNHFLELGDQGVDASQRATAQRLEVAIWARQWASIAAALAAAGVSLEVGRVVRVRGKVSVWEGAGRLSFTVSALDIEALLGGIAAARRRLIAALEREGLIGVNRSKVVTIVPLRIGLITSAGSEAHKDFLGQLQPSRFAFDVRLIHSLVQGTEAPEQIADALAQMEAFSPDLCVIVRGGGSRSDLASFDAELVARAIVGASFPIWIGVGHTGDISVADEVAHSSFPTPTACAKALVARVGEYWEQIATAVGTLAMLARSRLDGAVNRLESDRHSLGRAVRNQLERHDRELNHARDAMTRASERLISAERARNLRRASDLRSALERAVSGATARSEQLALVLRAYDPVRQMQRGWTIARDNEGRVVRSVDEITTGMSLSTRFADGTTHSIVDEVHRRDPSDHGV